MLESIAGWLRFTLAALTGVVSGFGIGGGTLLVILLTLVFGVAQRTAQGVNLLYFLPTACASLGFHMKKGRVRWDVWWPAALAGTVAAILAALLSEHMDVTLLRRLFGGLLAFTGIRELFAKQEPSTR